MLHLELWLLLLTDLFSLLPLPVSRNPFAKGLLSIFSCVIWEMEVWFEFKTNNPERRREEVAHVH